MDTYLSLLSPLFLSLPSPPYLQGLLPLLLRHIRHAQDEPHLRHERRGADGGLEVVAGLFPFSLSSRGAEGWSALGVMPYVNM